MTAFIIPGEYNAEAAHIDLIYVQLSDTAVASFC